MSQLSSQPIDEDILSEIPLNALGIKNGDIFIAKKGNGSSTAPKIEKMDVDPEDFFDRALEEAERTPIPIPPPPPKQPTPSSSLLQNLSQITEIMKNPMQRIIDQQREGLKFQKFLFLLNSILTKRNMQIFMIQCLNLKILQH